MELLKKRWVQISIAALLGMAIGAVFYPTSTITERVKKEITEQYELKISELKKEHFAKIEEVNETLSHREEMNRELREETSRKINSLTTENRELRTSMKRKKFRLVKPDGTIIEKEYEESQSEEISSVVTEVREEFNRKVSSIENKWKKIHTDRVRSLKEKFDSEIAKVKSEKKDKVITIEKEKVVKVNEKKFRPELGVTSDSEVYFHSTYNLVGPIFIGGGATVLLDTGELDHVSLGIGVEL